MASLPQGEWKVIQLCLTLWDLHYKQSLTLQPEYWSGVNAPFFLEGIHNPDWTQALTNDSLSAELTREALFLWYITTILVLFSLVLLSSESQPYLEISWVITSNKTDYMTFSLKHFEISSCLHHIFLSN